MSEITSMQFANLMKAYIEIDESPSMEEFAKIYKEFKDNPRDDVSGFVKEQCDKPNNGINCGSNIEPIQGEPTTEKEGEQVEEPVEKKLVEEEQVGGGKSKKRKSSKKKRKHKKRVSKKTK